MPADIAKAAASEAKKGREYETSKGPKNKMLNCWGKTMDEFFKDPNANAPILLPEIARFIEMLKSGGNAQSQAPASPAQAGAEGSPAGASSPPASPAQEPTAPSQPRMAA